MNVSPFAETAGVEIHLVIRLIGSCERFEGGRGCIVTDFTFSDVNQDACCMAPRAFIHGAHCRLGSERVEKLECELFSMERRIVNLGSKASIGVVHRWLFYYPLVFKAQGKAGENNIRGGISSSRSQVRKNYVGCKTRERYDVLKNSHASGRESE